MGDEEQLAQHRAGGTRMGKAVTYADGPGMDTAWREEEGQHRGDGANIEM